MAYSSNHMEGSTLTPEQTAQLYDTGSVLPTDGNNCIKADDIIEMTNHFRMFDWMLDHVDDPVDKTMVCTLQAILKRGTRQEFDPDRNIGGYKVLPNVISELEGIHTALPRDVPAAMDMVFDLYAQLTDDPYQIAKAHWMFESTHPLSDGNGRVGRMIMFKELLRINSIPTLIQDDKKIFYVRGLRQFPTEPGYLVDTLLDARDYYQTHYLEALAPKKTVYTYTDSWNRSEYEASHAVNPLRNPYVKSVWTEDDMQTERSQNTSEKRYPAC